MPRVHINTATASEISNLYDIGERRARHIVDYREANGSFHGPTDLAKVKNIPPKLAYTLSPHINWDLPQKHEPPKKRSWSDAIFWMSILICLLVALLSLVFAVIISFQRNDSNPAVRILAALSGVGTLLCFCAFVVFRTSVALTQNQQRVRQLARFGLVSMAIALFLGVPILLGSAFYWWSTLDTEKTSVTTYQLFMGVFTLILLYLFIVPQIIVWWRPQLSDSRLLSGIFDLAFGLSGLALVTLSIRSEVEGWPLWVLVLSGIAGVIIVMVSITAVRRGESFFRASLDFVDFRSRARSAGEMNNWRYWVSIYLPDPEQQKLAREALNEMHRPAPGQTLLKTMILGFGWWLLITVTEAIIELYAQDIWTEVFGRTQ